MTTLADLPEFVRPTGYAPTEHTEVLKPVFGSIGAQHVRFEVAEEYSGADSLAANREVRRPVEVCLIQNDRFCTVPLRVGRPPDPSKPGDPGITSELSHEQQVVLAPVYERFKTQRESTETDIVGWDVITDMERRLLVKHGIWTVEQLAAFTDQDLFRLGPGGQDLRERAKRHVLTKTEAKAPDYSAELEQLRMEKSELAERLARLEAAHWEREGEKGKAPKNKARWTPREP
jgi:hypothetical protein